MNEGFQKLCLFGGATNATYSVIVLHSRDDGADATSQPVLDLGRSAPWVRVAVQKLEHLGCLRRGWDSYGGEPLTPDAKRFTVEAIGRLDREELPVPGVVLGSAGTVQLEWRSGGKELDIDLGVGGEIEYAKCDRLGNVEEGHADRNSLDRLKDLTRWLVTH